MSLWRKGRRLKIRSIRRGIALTFYDLTMQCSIHCQ
nr:MAG TPA: hypothetical protein [Caudoviricetes sp.]